MATPPSDRRRSTNYRSTPNSRLALRTRAPALVVLATVVLGVGLAMLHGLRKEVGETPEPLARLEAPGYVPRSGGKTLPPSTAVRPERSEPTVKRPGLPARAPAERPSRAPRLPPPPPAAAPAALPVGSAVLVLEVRDSSGAPVPSARVALRSLMPGGGRAKLGTDDRAEARFEGLAPGRYAYRVEATKGMGAEGSLALESREQKRLLVRLGIAGLSISGFVRDRSGESVAGIQVSAARHRFASASAEGAGSIAPRVTFSQADGSFSIQDLPEGEYDVEAAGTSRFLPTSLVAKAGTRSLELVLRAGLLVQGTVADDRGAPLPLVAVRTRGGTRASDELVYADAKGAYSIVVQGDRGAPPTRLLFRLAGYEEKEVELSAAAVGGILDLDVELAALDNATLLIGRVLTDRGHPVEGAMIVLTPREGGGNHQVRADPEGRFSIPGVRAEARYQLRVVSGPLLRDATLPDLWVPGDPAPIEVVVESLERGRLRGRMIDVEGEPLPGFRLWLVSQQSTGAAVPITADEEGFFQLEEAAAGPFALDTRTSPRLRVSGLSLRADGETELEVVLDSGERELIGTVLDERGVPVPGARVELSWASEAGSGRSTSQRTTLTDPNGIFRFAQLGPGERGVRVQAGGRPPHEIRHDPAHDSAELEIRLGPLE